MVDIFRQDLHRFEDSGSTFTAPIHSLPKLPIPLDVLPSVPEASLQERLFSVLDAVGVCTGCPLAEAWIPNATGTALVCGAVWYGSSSAHWRRFHQSRQALSFESGQPLLGQVWATAKPNWERLDPSIGLSLAVPLSVSSFFEKSRCHPTLAVLAFWLPNGQPNAQISSLITAIATQAYAIKQLHQIQSVYLESHDRLMNLTNGLPGIVFFCQNEPSWTMTYASEGCLKLTGYTSQELISLNGIRTFSDIVYPQDLLATLAVIDQAIALHQPYVAEYRIRTKTGEEKWLWEKGCGIYDAHGQVLGIEGFISDITERKRAEHEFQQSEANNRQKEAFLRLILDNIPEQIFWKDRDLVYRGGNRHFAEAHGLPSADAIVGKTDWDLWEMQQAQEFRDRDRRVIETGTPEIHLTVHEHLPNGDEIWQDMSKIPIHDATGAVVGVLGNLEDITEQKKAEQALRQNKEMLGKREHYLATLVEVQRKLLASESRESTERTYTKIMELLGKAAGASRVSLFQNSQDSDGHLRARMITEWCADGIETLINQPHISSLDYRTFPPEWFDAMCQGCAHNSLVADLPDDDRLQFESQGVYSILDFPILVNGEFWGIIGYDNCSEARVWEPMEVDLLRVATGAIALSQERKQAQAALQQAESNYRSMVENSVEGIFQTTPDGRFLTGNSMLARICGYESPDDLLQNLTNIAQQLYTDPSRRTEFVRLMQENGAVWGFESEVYRQDGNTVWISECARCLYDSQGQIVAFEGTVEDITQRKRDEIELRKRDRLLEGVAEANTCLLTNLDLTQAIDQVLKILGISAEADRVCILEFHPHPQTGAASFSMTFEWTKPEIESVKHREHSQNQPCTRPDIQQWHKAFKLGKSISYYVDPTLEDNKILLLDNIRSVLVVPIFVDGQLWGVLGFDNCSSDRLWSTSEESILVAIAASLGGAIKRRHTEEQMRYQAFHDTLTGMPNRMLFDHRLQLLLTQARQTGSMLAVMFLDLDRFKNINDTLGHAVGDHLLRQVTQRLAACLREEDTIARWGGDEFTLLLPNICAPDDAAKAAQRIAEALKPAFDIEHHELYITCSIGVAIYPYNGRDAETLLKNADAALYCAKEQGRNICRFYSNSINPQASKLLTLDQSLHHALERDEFLVYYQPQINVETGEITQMEALLRWQHPQWGLISPKTFITLAEENSLIIPVGEWALRVACTQHKHWQLEGLAPRRVAVNLSACQFQHPNLVERISAILQEAELDAHCLELEITETAAMQDVDLTSTVLQELWKMGVNISIDDFGTGHSSLNYLKKFPLHGLKIDRSFIKDLVKSRHDAAIVTAVLTLGHGLDLTVIAEGVETQEQLDILRSLNCREMQGYWFSQPLDPQSASAFLQNAQNNPLAS